MTREAIGRKLGRSRVAVSNLLRLLDLPDEALALLEDGTLSEGHGRALLMAPDHDDRRRLAREVAAEGWTVRETEDRARALAQSGAAAAPPRPAAAAPVALPPRVREAVAAVPAGELREALEKLAQGVYRDRDKGA